MTKYSVRILKNPDEWKNKVIGLGNELYEPLPVTDSDYETCFRHLVAYLNSVYGERKWWVNNTTQFLHIECGGMSRPIALIDEVKADDPTN